LGLRRNSAPHLSNRDAGAIKVDSFDFLILPGQKFVLDREHESSNECQNGRPTMGHHLPFLAFRFQKVFAVKIFLSFRTFGVSFQRAAL
jgi:hypothetical protein